jgi:hypothetical protein
MDELCNDTEHCCTLKTLCAEDKDKVAKLIAKVGGHRVMPGDCDNRRPLPCLRRTPKLIGRGMAAGGGGEPTGGRGAAAA